jgi:hypothetical protein
MEVTTWVIWDDYHPIIGRTNQQGSFWTHQNSRLCSSMVSSSLSFALKFMSHERPFCYRSIHDLGCQYPLSLKRRSLKQLHHVGMVFAENPMIPKCWGLGSLQVAMPQCWWQSRRARCCKHSKFGPRFQHSSEISEIERLASTYEYGRVLTFTRCHDVCWCL